MNNEFFSVAGQAIVDVAPFIEGGGLHSKLHEVAFSIAKCHTAIKGASVGSKYNLRNSKEHLELSSVSREAWFNPQSKHYKAMHDLNDPAQVFTYLKHMEPVIDLGMCINIQIPDFRDYPEKHLAAKNKALPEKQHWLWFFAWLETQHIFKEIGRVIVFINERGQATYEHRDYPDGTTRRDQFILFTSPRKMFWVKDDTNFKHYATSGASIFDNTNYHGSDAPDFPTWSIRVDGLFTDEWMKKAGIYEHYTQDPKEWLVDTGLYFKKENA